MRADPSYTVRGDITRLMAGDAVPSQAGQWLQELLDHTPAVVYIKDRLGRYLLVNRVFEELFGITKSDWCGKTDYDLMTAEAAAGVRQNDLRVFAQGETIRIEERVPQSDGMHTYFSTKFPLRDAEGEIYAVAGISADITDRIVRLRTEEELRAAQEIQSRLYPGQAPEIPGYDIAGAAFPAQTVCGDYYDFVPLSQRRLGIALGDVSGHGLGPALQMVETRAYLRAALERELTPEGALRQLNRMLAFDLAQGSFVSMFLCFLDIDKRILLYAGAGHDGYLLRRDGRADHLMSTGLVLGLKESSALKGSAPWSLHPGDRLLLSTDGIMETVSPAGELFGWPRLLETIRGRPHATAAELVREVLRACEQFAGGQPRLDDATLVVVKVE